MSAAAVGQRLELSAKDLKHLHRQDAHCHLDGGDTLYLNGIYLRTAQSSRRRRCARWRPTDTDWRRSGCRCRRAPRGVPGVVVPRKTVHELHRLIEGSSASVKVGVARRRSLEIGRVTLTCS